MTKNDFKKIFIIILLGYFLITGFFYYLVGDQIRYKKTTNNIVMPSGDSATKEMTTGLVVKQDFENNIDILDSVSLLFTKFYREAYGSVKVSILDGDKVLYTDTINVKYIVEQIPYTLSLDKPIEAKDKTLTLQVEANANENHGIALMLNKEDADNKNLVHEGNTFYVAKICFATDGVDYIKAGEYYWYFVLAGGILLALLLHKSYTNYLHGKNDYIVRSILNIYQYKFLIQQLVSRDFKSKYKRSLLGVFWSFLNPLLTMIVQFLVFSTFFRADTQNYPVYLLSGVVCYNFFKETTDMCLSSITSNANLINKVYIPKYIFPMSKTLSSSINLGISLIPLLALSLVMGIKLTKSIFLIFFFLLCLIVFSLGVGMFLSALMVFFRDIQFLWGVIAQIWMYATPIFYPAEIVPEKYNFVIRFNPLYHFIGNLRKCLIDGVSPEPISYIYCLIFAIVAFVIGTFVFKKTQDKFTLYI